MEASQAALTRRLRRQARGCRHLGSDLYGALLDRAAEDVEADGPAWALLREVDHDPADPGAVEAIALLGAVHKLVLAGRLPDLARHYPSVGGDGAADGAWRALRAALADEAGAIRALLPEPIQTNEVGRCAALVGGFLTVAGETGRPLRLLEVGASAGLNLRWDRYRYEAAGSAWGEEASAVRFDAGWFEGDPPPLGVAARVSARRGCDTRPLDATTPEGEQTLRAYVWPDQADRAARLRAAIRVAREVPARVDEADAVRWLAERLAEPAADGAATVVYHSIFAQYLAEPARRELLAVIARAGELASGTAPLAWLRMEPAGPMTEVRLTTWPGGEERLLAEAGYHGRPVRWLGG